MCFRLSLLLAALTLGCAHQEKLYDLSGNVTFDGQPVPAGVIFFDPAGESGDQGFASIKQGKFDTKSDGKGVRGGKYSVRVLGYDGQPADEAPHGQPLFAEYTVQHDLPGAAPELNIDIPKR